MLSTRTAVPLSVLIRLILLPWFGFNFASFQYDRRLFHSLSLSLFCQQHLSFPGENGAPDARRFGKFPFFFRAARLPHLVNELLQARRGGVWSVVMSNTTTTTTTPTHPQSTPPPHRHHRSTPIILPSRGMPGSLASPCSSDILSGCDTTLYLTEQCSQPGVREKGMGGRRRGPNGPAGLLLYY